MDKFFVGKIAINVKDCFSKNYIKLSKKDKEKFQKLMHSLVTLINSCQQNQITFCKLSFIMYTEQSNPIRVKVGGSNQEIFIQL